MAEDKAEDKTEEKAEEKTERKNWRLSVEPARFGAAPPKPN